MTKQVRDPSPSPLQVRVIAAIRQYEQVHGKPPTLRELSDALGYASTTNAVQAISGLVRKGWASVLPGVRRNVRLTDGCP